MLLGQDLGRRHDGGLPALLDGLQRRHRRDDGLAAADVPLQQTLHGVWLGKVMADLGGDLLLRPSQGKGQLLQQGWNQSCRGLQLRGAEATPSCVMLAHRELLRQQLVESETPPSRGRMRR